MAFLHAHVRPGAEVVMEAVGLAERIERADLVVTGEGRFDTQSLRGKAPERVLKEAGAAGVPAIVLCGEAAVRPPGVRVESLADRHGRKAALARPAELLEALAAELAGELASKG